jgi:two-component system sensor histidine kinase KdpD
VALPLLDRVDLTNIVLLYLLAIVLIATLLGRGPAILASFLTLALLDFFFVPPRFSLTVTHTQHLFTFLVMLVVSLIISHLTHAYREKAREAERRAEESALLHRLAEALSGSSSREEVAARLDDVCRTGLRADAMLFLPTADDLAVAVVPEDRPAGVAEQVAALGVYQTGTAMRAGAELREGAATALIPLEGATRRRGVMALHFHAPGGAHAGSPILDAIATLVTTALERIHFVDVAQSTKLDMQAERQRNAVLSALSHDLRTPLTVLYGLADSLAQSSTAGPEDRATAERLRGQSRNLHLMVDNLLDLARLRSGRIRLRRDWQSVPELIGAVVQDLQPWLDTERLVFDWPADLPLVEVDAVLMGRLLGNLLENAVKYSPPGSPIGVGAQVADDRQTFRLWIDNAGDGFPPGRTDTLFAMFERGATESTVPGVGVGLAVCRAVADAHGGRITAINRDGGGARVLVELPLSASPAVPPEAADPS